MLCEEATETANTGIAEFHAQVSYRVVADNEQFFRLFHPDVRAELVGRLSKR